jgi:photosynthetic reaction center H subunit
MQTGAITGYIDVAQVALYVFWVFFFGLIFWLRREDKREGYPLVTEIPGERVVGFPPLPASKTYLLAQGGTVTTPRAYSPQPSFDATPLAAWPGAPLQPIGNAMLAGTGPAASAIRADTPDLMFTGAARIVPLRVATDHFIDPEGPDPRGMEVAGADGVVAGVISDIWVDRTEMTVRYLEMSLAAGPSILIPAPLVRINGQVLVQSIMGAQFADAPMLASADVVTLREEDKIQAYFASGHLYADPSRWEPII